MKKIGILTYHHIPNNGAALFAYSLQQALAETFAQHTVGIMDYRDSGMQTYERMKILKLYGQSPSFNLQRALTFARFQSRELRYDEGLGRTSDRQKLDRYFRSGEHTAWITGMDVWNIGAARWLPDFPNPYWLTGQGEAKKIAYAVSGYRSDDRVVQREKDRIGDLLADLDLIGVRDGYTEEMVRQARTVDGATVVRVPDPTFLYTVRESGAGEAMAAKGLDMDAPVVGMLLFGKDELSRSLMSHYKAQNYQLAALSMYNRYADVNFGHVLDPHTWAEAFGHFTFCITDRFHGAIFCLKSGIPFAAIEPDPLQSVKNSKLRDLLAEFGLLDCYFNPYEDDFRPEALLDRAAQLEREWGRLYQSQVEEKLTEMESRSREFLARIKQVVSG